MARESIAEIERIMVTLHKETNYDQNFLHGLIDHKNNTIAWLREREVAETHALSKMYDDMVDTILKEIKFVENHMITYERGTPNEKDTIT